MKHRITLYIISGLVGAIVLPIILQSGYIFAIDQALNTNGWTPKIGFHNYWIAWLSQIFVYLSIPIWVLEKLLVVMTFTLPVIGVYLYISKFISQKSSLALFFALSFSIFNPMLYSRFLDGQMNIYILYALFPLFIYFIKSFFEYKTLQSALIVGLWSLLMVLTTLHATYFIFFVGIIFFASYSKTIFTREYIAQYSTGFLVILFCHSLWAIPLFSSPDDKIFSTVSQIQSFDSTQQDAFGTIPSDKNPYREILSMRGYWGDYQNRFVASNNIFRDDSANDGIYFIWFLILLGVIYTYKLKIRDRHIFLSLGVLSVVLSLGVTNETIFSPINAILYEYLPYYAGFREPQKFVIFLIVSYIYFGYFGIVCTSEILKKLKIQKMVVLGVILCCAGSAVFYNFNMLFGFRGQVSVQQYPQEWNEIQGYLAENSCNTCEYDSLLFPWHGYMRVDFTKRVVGSWITRYLGDDILYGDTIELGNVYSSSTRSESQMIEKYVGPNGFFKNIDEIESENMKDFIADVSSKGIRHIILLKESDYHLYQNFLNIMTEQSLLEVVKENSMITLYTIK